MEELLSILSLFATSLNKEMYCLCVKSPKVICESLIFKPYNNFRGYAAGQIMCVFEKIRN